MPNLQYKQPVIPVANNSWLVLLAIRMLLFFVIVFLMTVISWMESIGAGEGRGWVGSRRRAKANTQTQIAVLCHQ